MAAEEICVRHGVEFGPGGGPTELWPANCQRNEVRVLLLEFAMP